MLIDFSPIMGALMGALKAAHAACDSLVSSHIAEEYLIDLRYRGTTDMFRSLGIRRWISINNLSSSVLSVDQQRAISLLLVGVVRNISEETTGRRAGKN
jgi:hypothetical protein